MNTFLYFTAGYTIGTIVLITIGYMARRDGTTKIEKSDVTFCSWIFLIVSLGWIIVIPATATVVLAWIIANYMLQVGMRLYEKLHEIK